MLDDEPAEPEADDAADIDDVVETTVPPAIADGSLSTEQSAGEIPVSEGPSDGSGGAGLPVALSLFLAALIGLWFALRASRLS